MTSISRAPVSGHAGPPRSRASVAEENAGSRPEVQRPRLLRKARLDVPRRVHGQPRPLGKAYLLRPLPRLAPVGRALDRRPIDDMVRRRIDGAVARVDRRVVNTPAVKQGTLGLPGTAGVIPPQQEKALTRAHQG